MSDTIKIKGWYLVDMGEAEEIYLPKDQVDGFKDNTIVFGKKGEYIEELRQAIRTVQAKYQKEASSREGGSR